ncbi:toast rack family protein [Roseivirga sp. BDSF3-8]|uniref:toast rack family protein n=1 Tax=Roseivirga sp. BDSF3-8 TaxID=3241598 RepID=UPI0035323B86
MERDWDNDNKPGDLDVFTRTISLSDDIQTLKTNIEMGAGVLTVNGTDDYVLDSRFQVDKKDNLFIDYNEEGDRGVIQIRHEKDVDIHFGDNDMHDEWDIKLNRRIPQDVDIMLGAGESTLDLSDFNLRNVDITMGAGENNIDLRNSSPERLKIEAGVGDIQLDLTGKWKNDCRIDVSGGIGHLTLILPEDADIELKVNGGLGNVEAPSLERRGRKYYQNGNGPELDIKVNAGIGSLEIITR